MNFWGKSRFVGEPNAFRALVARALVAAALGREDLTITVCTMYEKQGQARLLVPVGKEPVHAFGGPLPLEAMPRVLRQAREALGGE